jgi:hypothetical protein
MGRGMKSLVGSEFYEHNARLSANEEWIYSWSFGDGEMDDKVQHQVSGLIA